MSTGWLRDLAAQATPGPWDTYAIGSEGHGVFGQRGDRRHRITLIGHGAWEDDQSDAALIALAPDLAVLLADTIDALETAYRYREAMEGLPEGTLGQQLLPRLAALQPKEPA